MSNSFNRPLTKDIWRRPEADGLDRDEADKMLREATELKRRDLNVAAMKAELRKRRQAKVESP